jgi:hypothetical protein
LQLLCCRNPGYKVVLHVYLTRGPLRTENGDE